MPALPHALVVGGTGMLRGVVLHLGREGYAVSVIARSSDRLRRLAEDAGAADGAVTPIPLDYRRTSLLERSLQQAQYERGRITLAICWIHSTAPAALPTVAQRIRAAVDPPRLFHLIGSATENPLGLAARTAPIRALGGVSFRQVLLGYMVEHGRSRWLTDAEISHGVIDAIQGDKPLTIIGIVEPWSQRP